MLQTRIYPVTGFHVDVQESYDEVKKDAGRIRRRSIYHSDIIEW